MGAASHGPVFNEMISGFLQQGLLREPVVLCVDRCHELLEPAVRGSGSWESPPCVAYLKTLSPKIRFDRIGSPREPIHTYFPWSHDPGRHEVLFIPTLGFLKRVPEVNTTDGCGDSRGRRQNQSP